MGELAPLVSVITPVYNGAAYIGQCLESILAQSFGNWQCIVLNNCSTDGTGDIARQYAAHDARIRVEDNPRFLPAVANYNTAIRMMPPESKYCKIVFADDWIFPTCLECMVALAEAYPSVSVVGAYGLEGTHVKWTGLQYPSTVVPGREICRRLLLERLYVFGSATSVMYRAECVRRYNPFYNEANIHSDMEVCLELLKTSDFGFVHQVLTYTREEEPGCLRRRSAEMDTYLAGRLYNVVTFGPIFLTSTEYKMCLRQLVAEYYGNLSGAVLRMRDKTFWEFHKRTLTEAGVGFSVGRLIRTMSVKLCLAALNPYDTVKKVCEIVRQLSGEGKATPHIAGL